MVEIVTRVPHILNTGPIANLNSHKCLEHEVTLSMRDPFNLISVEGTPGYCCEVYRSTYHARVEGEEFGVMEMEAAQPCVPFIDGPKFKQIKFARSNYEEINGKVEQVKYDEQLLRMKCNRRRNKTFRNLKWQKNSEIPMERNQDECNGCFG
ncbi:hypothetical protein CAPTEDRAFT_205480 [Capitella teleta]|uniref:Uncharacterized protein n=1 Tax=Capitella teleta TaxID=283909 RepID=R7UN99_CAPTE|nr:hypothetical protein CAPTEDRAFT_205480 [Capitella teleta]|eukprot:ELU05427.1 hypothetical protein CAPTEDRAFT_205480 [Capitella teleta]